MKAAYRRKLDLEGKGPGSYRPGRHTLHVINVNGSSVKTATAAPLATSDAIRHDDPRPIREMIRISPGSISLPAISS